MRKNKSRKNSAESANLYRSNTPSAISSEDERVEQQIHGNVALLNYRDKYKRGPSLEQRY